MTSARVLAFHSANLRFQTPSPLLRKSPPLEGCSLAAGERADVFWPCAADTPPRVPRLVRHVGATGVSDYLSDRLIGCSVVANA